MIEPGFMMERLSHAPLVWDKRIDTPRRPC
jgi:hypothetical protein